MRQLILLGVAVLAGCADAGAEAEQRYEMVKRQGSPNEKCAAIKEVAATYLELRDEEKYKYWHLLANSYCLNVEVSRQIGIEPR